MSTTTQTKDYKQLPRTSTYLEGQSQSRPRFKNPHKYQQKIHIIDPQHAPRQAHIQLHLSSKDNRDQQQHHLPVTAVHNSGCAISVIITSSFKELMKKRHISIIPPPHKTDVVSITGVMEEVEGTADIIQNFQGLNKTKLSITLNVVIHPTITQDFLLGRDFKGSDAKAVEANDFPFLTKDYNTFQDQLSTLTLDKSLCNVINQHKKYYI
jgi:hypothetical protein